MLSKRLAIVVLALYAVVLCVGPVLHHDFICHLKSPAHCQACTASPAAAPPEPGQALLAVLLPAAETVAATTAPSPFRTSTPLLPGRAPPA